MQRLQEAWHRRFRTLDQLRSPGHVNGCEASCRAKGKHRDGLKVVAPFFKGPDERQSQSFCFVDTGSLLWKFTWNDGEGLSSLDWEVLFSKPLVSTSRLEFGPALEQLWRDSSLMRYGRDAITRCDHTAEFPILKIAHPTARARQHIQHEYQVLLDVSPLDLPIPRVSPSPILDNDMIVGFRMERLVHIPSKEMTNRIEEIRQLLDRLHACGYSHGDVTPTNVMKKPDGTLMLIDFGHAGKIGEAVPDFIRMTGGFGDFFDTATDQTYLDRFASMIVPS